MTAINIKKAKTPDEAWALQETFPGHPGGWIQWKGTSVCMDLHCECGCVWHVDADFAYYVKCPHCGHVYLCNGHIELIQITEPNPTDIVDDINCVVVWHPDTEEVEE